MPTELSPAELDAIRARHEAATPGPWESVDETALPGWIQTVSETPYPRAVGKMHIADIRGWGDLTGKAACAMTDKAAGQIMDANAAFVRHSRTDIPALLAHADALTAKVERLEGERDFVRSLETTGGDMEHSTTFVQIDPRGVLVAAPFGAFIDKAMEVKSNEAN